MVKKSGEKPYALMAGVCYGIYGLYSIATGNSIFTRVIFGINSEDTLITVLNVIFWIVMIGMSVALFLKKEKAVIVFAGVNAMLNLYDIVRCFFETGYSLRKIFRINLINPWGFLDFIAYVWVVALAVLTLKKNTAVRKSWFVAGVTMLLGHLVARIDDIYSSFIWIKYEWGFFSYILGIRRSILCSLIEFAGLMLIGLWLKEHDFSLSKVEHPNEYSKSDSQTVYSSSLSDTVIGGADKLKIYNELLEDGTITQEEFNAKKKQILGL